MTRFWDVLGDKMISNLPLFFDLENSQQWHPICGTFNFPFSKTHKL